MKLTEALKQRKQLINEIAMLEERLLEGMVYYPEVEKSLTPVGVYTKAECEEMVKALKEKRQQLVALKAAICEANNEAIEEDGTSIQKLVIERGEKGAEVAFLRKMREKCNYDRNRYYGASESELKRKTMYSAKSLDEDIDALMGTVAEVDKRLASLNQKVEIRLG